MKLHYTKKRQRINGILGIAWLILGIFQILFGDFNSWNDYFFIIMSVVYLSMYFYENHYQYITLENSILKVNSLFGKSVPLAEIKQIKEFAGDYIISTASKELTINTQIMDPESRNLLKQELDKWPIEWK